MLRRRAVGVADEAFFLDGKFYRKKEHPGGVHTGVWVRGERRRRCVEAAENWGTYVTVHAYTPRAVRQAIEAGVTCIDHGHLLDDDTAKLMADKGIYWSMQPFGDDGRSSFVEGSADRVKQLTMFAGTDRLCARQKIQTQNGMGNRHPV